MFQGQKEKSYRSKEGKSYKGKKKKIIMENNFPDSNLQVSMTSSQRSMLTLFHLSITAYFQFQVS